MACGAALSHVAAFPLLQKLMPAALFLMLYPVMLSGDAHGLRAVLARPGMLCISLALNFVLSPLLIGAAAGLACSGEFGQYAPGVLLYGCIPCGGMVPAYTVLLGGNLAASVTIMIASLCLSVLIAPLWLGALAGTHITLPLALVAVSLCASVLLPFAAARGTVHILPRLRGGPALDRFRARCAPLSRWGMLLLFFIIFSQGGSALLPTLRFLLRLLPLVALFHLLLCAISLAVGALTRSLPAERTSLAVCTIVKNNALAAAVAGMALGPSVAPVTAALGPLVQFPIMLAMVKWRQHRLAGCSPCLDPGPRL